MKEQFRVDAQGFVKWLSGYLDDPLQAESKATQTLHQWVASSSRAAKRAGDIWSCSSLFDAYQKYYWKSVDPTKEDDQVIYTFAESEQCLRALGQTLNQAIDDHDAEAALTACENILRWGGVAQWKVAGLIRSLEENLPAYLAAVRAYLNGCDGSTPFVVLIDGAEYGLEVDSGTTKIYSLLNDDWAIYDGRVGAALGLLVRRWVEAEKIEAVPQALRFAWGYEDRRNPNRRGDRTFPMFGPAIDRFKHNLYLNWLLEYVLEKESRFDGVAHPLRALEAALFMIGYSVKDRKGRSDDPEADAEKTELDTRNDQARTFREAIIRQFGNETEAVIPMQKNGNFGAILTEQGVEVSNLGASRLLEWRVFDEVERFLKEKNGQAQRGNAVNGKLGDDKLPLDSVEGYIAQVIYGKEEGDFVFRRITPIANILVWAGVCKHGQSSLHLVD